MPVAITYLLLMEVFCLIDEGPIQQKFFLAFFSFDPMHTLLTLFCPFFFLGLAGA